jgi:hypothetical protein
LKSAIVQAGMLGKQPMRGKTGVHRCGGQAMIEYVIIAAILVSTVSIMAVFLQTFRQHSSRTLELAASEYP